ncbi:CU044_2847 family protein [Streptomyces sp. NPDC001177]
MAILLLQGSRTGSISPFLTAYVPRRSEREKAGGGNLTPLTRIPLEGGGYILVEETGAAPEGPVKAGRISDAIRELPVTLQGALEPITEAARVTLDQLRKACPDEVAVEFGVDLAVEAGAVITKSQASCHLKVTLSWTMNDAGQAHGGERRG